MTLPDADQILASAIRFLLAAQEREEATMLCTCALDIEGVFDASDGTRVAWLTLRGPRAVYELSATVENWRLSFDFPKVDPEAQACQESLERI
jgi:hypothetical protein